MCGLTAQRAIAARTLMMRTNVAYFVGRNVRILENTFSIEDIRAHNAIAQYLKHAQ